MWRYLLMKEYFDTLPQYIEHLQSRGRYCFLRSDAIEMLCLSDNAFKKAAHRLARKNKVIRIRGDFYGILPLEYQASGSLPASWFIDSFMRSLEQLWDLIMKGYDLKGLYSLEEYYAKNLLGYYRAISVGDSHNYYFGRVESDITNWIEYFIEGVAFAFENVVNQMNVSQAQGGKDYSSLLRTLDPKQRKALELFKEYEVVTSKQIGELFGFQPRTSTALCKKWVEAGYLEIADSSFKSRKYQIAEKFKPLLDS